jgi:hypothetical protein
VPDPEAYEVFALSRPIGSAVELPMGGDVIIQSKKGVLVYNSSTQKKKKRGTNHVA